MDKISNEKRGVRILGRQVGTVLSVDEISKVSGGGPLEADSFGGTDNPPHSGTCTNEQDCD